MITFLVSGDNRHTLRALAADSIDSVVCDPPYGLSKEPDMTEVLTHWLRGDDYTASGGGFMGKTWDSFVPGPATWKEVYRVLKPGGHVVMFSGTRTWDIATLAMRLAGFEIRDGLMWLYGSGFPKSMNVSQAIDKAAGAERVKIPVGSPVKRMIPGADQNNTGSWIKDNGWEYQPGVELPATTEAEQWNGWGTALKPAWEPIVLARKPIRSTIAANVLAHGTGALNIDATRIATTDKLGGGAEGETRPDQKTNEGWTRPWMEDPEMQAAHAERVRANVLRAEAIGRFPANVILSHAEACIQTGRTDMEAGAQVGLGDADGMEVIEVWECVDDCPVKLLDDQTGVLTSGHRKPGNYTTRREDGVYMPWGRQPLPELKGDKGGASRFFYCAKVSKTERNLGMPTGIANNHPTVKPIALMEWLIKLVTPPGGVVLDPWVGSGSTGIAAVRNGFGFLGLDSDAKAIAIARHRLAAEGVEVETLGTVAPDEELAVAK